MIAWRPDSSEKVKGSRVTESEAWRETLAAGNFKSSQSRITRAEKDGTSWGSLLLCCHAHHMATTECSYLPLNGRDCLKAGEAEMNQYTRNN